MNLRGLLFIVYVMPLMNLSANAKRNPFCYADQKTTRDCKQQESEQSFSGWHAVQTVPTTTGSLTIVHDDQGNVRTLKIEQKKALQLE